MPFAHLRPEFVDGIDGRIDVAPDPRLRIGHGCRDRFKGRVADYEKVDIARAAQLTACGRPEYKRQANPVAQRRQSLAEDLDDACSFENERLQLGKDRRFAIGLEIDLPPLDGPPQHAAAGERLELALYGPLRGARLAHNLAQVKGLLRVPQQPRQHPPAGLSKENTSGLLVGGRNRTHFEYIRTRSGYERQAQVPGVKPPRRPSSRRRGERRLHVRPGCGRCA